MYENYIFKVTFFLGKTAEVTFLSALLVWRKDKQKDQQLALLTESVDIHFRSIRGIPVGYTFELQLIYFFKY